MTKISVIIATKNGSAFIEKAISSVLKQTFSQDPVTSKELELIVVNDGSTDSTAEIIDQLSIKDHRIKLVNLEKNVGPGLARDRGIEEADGEYIAFIDDDDVWISLEKLSLQNEFLDLNLEYVLVGADTIRIVNEKGAYIKTHKNPTTDSALRASMLLRNCFSTSSVLFRKSSYFKAGGFKAMYLNEDYDLWFRMGLEGKFANVNNCDIEYTIRPSNASSSKALEMHKNTLSLVKQYRAHYPGYIIGLCRAYGRILFLYVKNLF